MGDLGLEQCVTIAIAIYKLVEDAKQNEEECQVGKKIIYYFHDLQFCLYFERHFN